MMRVIAGEFKGRRLASPRGANLRATTDKVREALFNILSFKIEGASFLDVYAGSGSVGIEAISRGASRVVFIENDKNNIALLKKNLSLLPDHARAEVVCGDALNYLKKNEIDFDIIFLDPPYEAGDLENLLQTLGCCDSMKPQSVVIFEHFHKKILPDVAGDFSVLKRYRYGGTTLSLYVKK
jgi:16S rRNA (guanine(966)-N(2))-methyltransferase RsmD